jgi:hypothetical protein
MAVASSQVINVLQKSPTGAKLLAEAQKKGVKINLGANLGANVNGQYDPKNNTISVKNGDLETMVETLAHELVHATTPENGNSMNEEKTAFLIGEQVAAEAGVDNNHRGAAFWNQHVEKSYSGLAKDNGIMGALNALGIAANDVKNNPNGIAGAQYAAAPAGNDPFTTAMNQAAGIAAGQANPVQAAANPLGAAQQVGQQAAPNGVAGNMQMFMQFIMMILQMIMQMFGGQMGNMDQMMGGNQMNPLQQNNPLAPQAGPQTAPTQQKTACPLCGGKGCPQCGGTGYVQQAQAPQHLLNPNAQVQPKQQYFVMTAMNLTA